MLTPFNRDKALRHKAKNKNGHRYLILPKLTVLKSVRYRSQCVTVATNVATGSLQLHAVLKTPTIYHIAHLMQEKQATIRKQQFNQI